MTILDYRVVVSGLELIIDKNARDIHFNQAMLCLYKSGCRRIRAAIPVRPRTGDADIYLIRGYLN